MGTDKTCRRGTKKKREKMEKKGVNEQRNELKNGRGRRRGRGGGGGGGGVCVVFFFF